MRHVDGNSACDMAPSLTDMNCGWPNYSRRQWLAIMGAATVGLPWVTGAYDSPRARRQYHVSLSPRIVAQEPEFVEMLRASGVDKIWLDSYFFGHSPFPPSLLEKARQRVVEAGMAAGLITVPLGHPGDSLGASEDGFPTAPPEHWKLGERPDGQRYSGTSLHEPATNENVEALQRLRSLKCDEAFMDDDFRLARSPGEIGGCFCAAHRDAFLNQAGLAKARWQELLEDVRERRLTTLLRLWVDWTCDQLTASFRIQKRAWGNHLGIMAMYLGAEKAGIRLKDYRRDLFRVGELMFNDGAFDAVKGKTDELFSVLFHRRFVMPERAYSETTAYPANQLSARNLAAKLVISTITDVRNTMFMSGLTPFPREHWQTLAPAMREQSRIHEALAGHQLHGPFKLNWGDAQRYVGDDQPFSLWLALGIPFEAVEQPSSGWNFISDFDARHLSQHAYSPKCKFICRSSSGVNSEQWHGVKEELTDLFAFKRSIRDQLSEVPIVEEESPAVCAWYPHAGRVLLWNLIQEPRRLTVVHRARRLSVDVPSLGTSLLEGFHG